jgi:hypothetical protein
MAITGQSLISIAFYRLQQLGSSLAGQGEHCSAMSEEKGACKQNKQSFWHKLTDQLRDECVVE